MLWRERLTVVMFVRQSLSILTVFFLFSCSPFSHFWQDPDLQEKSVTTKKRKNGNSKKKTKKAQAKLKKKPVQCVPLLDTTCACGSDRSSSPFVLRRCCWKCNHPPGCHSLTNSHAFSSSSFRVRVHLDNNHSFAFLSADLFVSPSGILGQIASCDLPLWHQGCCSCTLEVDSRSSELLHVSVVFITRSRYGRENFFAMHTPTVFSWSVVFIFFLCFGVLAMERVRVILFAALKLELVKFLCQNYYRILCLDWKPRMRGWVNWLRIWRAELLCGANANHHVKFILCLWRNMQILISVHLYFFRAYLCKNH